MKHHRLTLPNVAPRPLPEHSLLQNISEIENKIARRAYELFASSGSTDGHDLEDWLLAESEVLDRTPLEISETEKELTLTAGLPGFSENEIEIRVEPGRLFISGKHDVKSEDEKKGQTVYSERSNEVFRTIDLPAAIDPERAKATLSKGELEITMPKQEAGKMIPVETKAA